MTADAAPDPGTSDAAAPEAGGRSGEATEALELLDTVIRRFGGRARVPQQTMTAAVADALAGSRHLLVQAPTGVGKSNAYAVPAALAALRAKAEGGEGRVVIATATRALQDQLCDVDLPRIADTFAEVGRPFRFAVVKGRNNYLCNAKLAEPAEQQLLPDPTVAAEVKALRDWGAGNVTGERSTFPGPCSDRAWSELSVSSDECPGASRCPFGEVCFTERARQRAHDAQLVVVNTALFAVNAAADGNLLPGYDAVILDEAHELEGSFTSTFSTEISSNRLRRLRALASAAGLGTHGTALDRSAADLDSILDLLGDGRLNLTSVLPTPTDDEGPDGVAVTSPAGGTAADVLAAHRARTTPTSGGGRDADRHPVPALERVVEVLTVIGERCRQLSSATSGVEESRKGAADRAASAADTLANDIRVLLDPGLVEGNVTWVEASSGRRPVLACAPIDVGRLLHRHLWSGPPAVACSATLTVGGDFAPVAAAWGLPADKVSWDGLEVGSPFNHREHSFLYVPKHLPEPRSGQFEGAALAELLELAEAAGGRTLALFTSRRALQAAVLYLRARSTLNVLSQDEGPRSALVEEFRSTPRSVLCGTQGFWVGLDLAGLALTNVVIDKIPFPRPDDPVIGARRDLCATRGGNPFFDVDLPRAARLLAQGAGRLIRTVDDQGVITVLDRRLATARYRTLLLNTLPPARRTIDPDAVKARLRALDELASGRPVDAVV